MLGAAFGAVNSACNQGLGPAFAAKLIGNDWGWLAAGLAACWSGLSWKGAFGRGVAFLDPAVLAYYLADSLAGVYATVDVDDPTGPARFSLSGVLVDSFFYLVVATLTAAGLALLVVLIRRGGVPGLFARVAVPGYVTWDAWHTSSFLSQDPWPSHDPVLLKVTGLLWPTMLALTVAVLLTGLWRLRSRTRRSSSSSAIGSAPSR